MMNRSTEPVCNALPPMRSPLDRFLRGLVSLILLAFACFCGFGFVASFELPGPPGLPWKIGYAIAGLVSLAAAAVLFRGTLPARRNR